MERKLYEVLAGKLNALRNTRKTGNTVWETKHEGAIGLLLESMPSGSGFDNGTRLAEGACTDEMLVFETAFHHMHESGMYDGWTEHKVIVTPSFIGGFNIRVTGKNRNDIKEYIAESFHNALTTLVTE